MKFTLNLLDLDVQVEHKFHKPTVGGSHESGEREIIPAEVEITSIKTDGIEILPLVPTEDVERFANKILEEEYANY
jgi:hypothetical protein